MWISEVTVTRFRGWKGPVRWCPGKAGLLVGPNSGGKTSLLQAVDLVLNPHWNPYKNELQVHDFFDLEVDAPFEVEVILAGLSDEDVARFEESIEGRRDDGSFGGWESAREEFDLNQTVLRLGFRGVFGEPSYPFFMRPERGEATVSQRDRLYIGWHYLRSELDPLHELAFYSNSVFSKLFETVELGDELDAIREAIEGAKGPLLAEPDVADTLQRLEEAAQRLRLVDGENALDFAVAGLSDRRVLQSLQLVVRGHRSNRHLPLASHGRGVLRVLLLAALLQKARLSSGNLILAVEEPEQNLEPINQRLVTRSLLHALPVRLTSEESPPTEAQQDITSGGDEARDRSQSGFQQVLVSSHSPDVAGNVPLAQLHLVREFADGPDIRHLSEALPPEHKFFERHARGPLVDGLYADLVLLVEGPTERGGLPDMWAAAWPDNGLDERRIELVDCESVNKMPSFVRFYRAVGIPVAALCDGDKPEGCEDVLAAGPDLLIRWEQHENWEGVLAAEADVEALEAAIEECRATLGDWAEHANQLRERVEATTRVASAPGADSLPGLLRGCPEQAQREALREILLGRAGLTFKSALYGRLIARGLPAVPPTIVRMMELVHQVANDEEHARGEHRL